MSSIRTFERRLAKLEALPGIAPPINIVIRHFTLEQAVVDRLNELEDRSGAFRLHHVVECWDDGVWCTMRASNCRCRMQATHAERSTS